MEGLSALLPKADLDGSLQGVQVCHDGPRINHLFFADDSLIFMKANEASALKLQSILALYEDVSGQMLNKEKSTVMFSKWTTQATKRKFKRLLQISDEAFNERYLGLPIHLGRSKNKAFGYLRPCFAQVVHVGLLSIIPRGFGGNTSDTQSPLFLCDPLPPNIRTQKLLFCMEGSLQARCERRGRSL
jgi:hypothetical protein